MSNAPQGNERRAFIFVVALALAVGTFLRLYLLQSQVLVDDEWHSMSFVTGRSLPWVLVNFTVPSGFTSIPLNVYQWVLLHSVGWSETLLRLPSVVLGLLCLLVAPLLARPLIGTRRAALFALLLAIAPLHIFYTRISRPYSAVAFFSVIAFLCAARWMRTAKRSDALGFAVGGVLAVYCHPFAAIMIGTLGASIFVASMIGPRSSLTNMRRPTRPQAIGVLAAMGCAGAVLLLPALINSMQTSFFDVAQQGSIYVSSWIRLASLMSGVANPSLVLLFWVLAGIGVVHLYRRDPWLAVTIVALYPIQMLSLWVTRPHSCHVGIVLARYSMPLVPVTLFLVATGWQSGIDICASRFKVASGLQWMMSAGLVAVLAFCGPLRATYSSHSQFTNHGIFQHDYASIDWERSFDSEFAPPDYPIQASMSAADISRFYAKLREVPSNRPIVEYPMMIGDHFNPHYFYQWHHRRPIRVGYVRNAEAPTPLAAGGVYGNTYIDEVINLVADANKLQFINLVDLRDMEAMRDMDVEYVILHKQFEADLWKMGQPPALQTLINAYRKTLPVVHEDARIVVFGLDT